MPTFTAPDGTLLAYRLCGNAGDPVVCLPGGPMHDSRYLADLGGLQHHRMLAYLDLRGTGRSAAPDDPSSYRCDRQVDDVEAIRQHLGLERLDLLAHSAGVNLAVLYAARYPQHVGRLALIGPSTRAVDITITGEMRRKVARLRKDEPWFPDAFAALETLTAGAGGESEWEAIAPFFVGHWDVAARRAHAGEKELANPAAAEMFVAVGAFDPVATRAALADLMAPTLVLVGEFDLNSPPEAITEFARLFPAGRYVVQPGAGHTPWRDDTERFVTTVAEFLV